MQELWKDSQRTFFKTPQQLPKLKEQTDSYGSACGYGRHHGNWGRQHQQGRTNGYSKHNSYIYIATKFDLIYTTTVIIGNYICLTKL